MWSEAVMLICGGVWMGSDGVMDGVAKVVMWRSVALRGCGRSCVLLSYLVLLYRRVVFFLEGGREWMIRYGVERWSVVLCSARRLWYGAVSVWCCEEVT